MEEEVKTYSLESISSQRKNKKAEIQVSKMKMQQIAQDLFAPPATKNKMEGLMQHVNTGIAAYDGIMTGMKILQRIRGFFRKK